MFVVIEKQGEIIHDVEIDKDSVIIGRGSGSDIRIKEDCISRKHLLLQRDGDRLFIQLLAPQNWIVLDGKKVLDSEQYPFFEFNTVMLPGDMKVRIAFEKPEEDAEVDPSINITPLIREQRESTRSLPREEPNSKKGSKKKIEAADILFGLMGISVVIFWAYYLLTSKIPFIDQ